MVEADRTCIAVLDACEKYPTSHLKLVLERPEMASIMFYYTTAFFIESNYEALKTLMYHSNSYNKAFGFNIAAGYIFEEKLEQMKEIISYSDFIICNKDDAHSCARHLSAEIGISADEKDRETIALAMTKFLKVSSRPRVVIITDSQNPIAVAS